MFQFSTGGPAAEGGRQHDHVQRDDAVPGHEALPCQHPPVEVERQGGGQRHRRHHHQVRRVRPDTARRRQGLDAGRRGQAVPQHQQVCVVCEIKKNCCKIALY